MHILDRKKLEKAKTTEEFYGIITKAPEGIIYGKKVVINGQEIKYSYTEKLKDLLEFYGVDIEKHYNSFFERMKKIYGDNGLQS